MKSAVVRKLRKHVWTVVLIYTVLGLSWIFFSDTLANMIFTHEQVVKAQLYKGTFFIFLTAALLFVIIRRKNKSILHLFLKTRRNMRSFKDTFEQTAVGMAHLSVEGNWIRINKRLCNILGYKRKKLLNIPVAEIIHPEDLEAGRRKDQKIIRGEIKSYVMEKRYLTKSGKIIHARLTKSAIKDSHGDIKYISSIIENITKQKEAENKLVESLKHKKALLAEIHHRVKNNLAVISGLLELQAFSAKNKVVKKILKESLMRIKSMAMIHESYYKSETLTEVYLDEYVDEFVRYVRQSFEEMRTNITLDYTTDRIPLNINQAIPCGLLLNELLINAYLHAFKRKKKGDIIIKLQQQDENVMLQVQDNGIGLPDAIDIENPSSLGMTIIKSLVKQLDGTIAVQRKNGTTFTITFHKEDKSGSSANFKIDSLVEEF